MKMINFLITTALIFTIVVIIANKLTKQQMRMKRHNNRHANLLRLSNNRTKTKL